MAKAEEYVRREHELFEQQVIRNDEISPGVFLISVRRRFDFIPGQVVKLATERIEPPRIYSICSGNRENELRVLFNVKDGGYLTPRMAALKQGDQLLVSKPYGGFHGTEQPAWWIAAGTGIAPFYSMFSSGLVSGKVLVHGVSFLNQFYFQEEFGKAPGLVYYRCCSRESGTGVFTGRVTDFLKTRRELPPDRHYYICGKALMVVEVRDLLIDRGIPYDHIVAEIYF